MEIFWIEIFLGLHLGRLSLYFHELVKIANWKKKMVKEEKRGKEKKKLKKNVNKKFLEFFPWDHVDYHEQIVNVFATIKELPSRRLNP